MLLLPASHSTPALISFGLFTAAAGALVCLLAHLLLIASPLWILAALVWVAGIGVILKRNYLWLERPYNLYNRAIRRLVVEPFRHWILAVTFCVVIMANRPFADRMRQARRPGGTTWHIKTIEHLLGNSAVNDVAVDETGDARPLSALVQWISRTRNWWVLPLIPFMLALRMLDTDEERPRVTADTYTLY